MSRSCQSGMFSSPTTGRCADDAREAARCARRPSGCACAASPTSPSSRPRTAPRPRGPRFARGAGSRSRTGRASDAQIASAPSSSAWRSREITCVDTGSGSRPSRSHAMRSTSGSIAAYVPTVPDSWPTRHDSSARSSRSRAAVELERPAGELPAERRRLGVDPVRAADADRPAVLFGAARRPPRAPGRVRRRGAAPPSRIWRASAVSTTSDDVSP